MRALALTMLLLLAVAGCGEDEPASGVSVVATTTQVADLVRNVGGDRVDVTGLLAANTDPHGYELRPRDVEAIAEAPLVVGSGGDVDDWLDEAIEASGTEAEVVTLLDVVDAAPDDPHWWQDPRNAVRGVAAIEEALAAADPEGRAQYAANAERYTQRIEALDAAVERCWERVPATRRKLVTTHDALGYYARRYGLEVIGTVIPSRSTQGQASAGELAALAETIRRERVELVFPEESVGTDVEQAIARETGARVGRALWADALGPPGSEGESYLGSLAANTRALVEGAAECRLPE